MLTSNYQRQAILSAKLNELFTKITGNKKDYFSSLSNDELISLKYALSDINNILTLKVGLGFIDHISLLFQLTDDEKKGIINEFDTTNPNANGNDVKFRNDQFQILAEIKSTVPLNEKDRFGIAQINSILDDAIKLIHGGKKRIDPSDAYKFIGILDLGTKTDKALESVFRTRKLKGPHELREKRNQIKKCLIPADKNLSLKTLSKDKVYIVKIRI